jgi:hypothetical protein
MSVLTCPEIRHKTANEVRNGIVSFIGKLDTSELLTGTPTASASPSGLTFASVAVNTTARTLEDGTQVAIGQGVQFRVSGGTAGTKYIITVQAGTTSSPAQTVEQYAVLWVRDS